MHLGKSCSDPVMSVKKEMVASKMFFLVICTSILTPLKTNECENQWLVQMYSLLKVRPFLGDIREFSRVYRNAFFSSFFFWGGDTFWGPKIK